MVLNDVTALRTQAAELARSNRDLREFAYTATHDLREPIRHFVAFTELLAGTLATTGEVGDEVASILEQLQRAANRAYAMVLGLRDFAEAASAQLSHEDCDLSLLARIAADGLPSEFATGHPFIDIAPLPHATGDPKYLTKLFAQLISNALKFASRGRDPEIRITGEVTENGVTIGVTDNGMGVPEQKCEQIFEVFNRLHNDSDLGEGIGLAVCRQIVERHGGRIRAQPNPDSPGLTISFTLPGSKGPASRSPGAAPDVSGFQI